MSSNWVTNGFWWLLTLVLYLLLNLDISSLTVGILRSRCIVSLVTLEDGETRKVLRRVQIYIDEDPGNRLLNKFIIILI